MVAPLERLPDPAPLPAFFFPNFLGILFALMMEKCSMESLLASLLHQEAHRFSLLGLGVFAIANVNSYLGGSVVLARIKYNIKLPNLYADTRQGDDKNAVMFNCVQRGHQNFLETFAQTVLAVQFTAFVAGRPNVAGMMLLTISICRIGYAIGYKSDIAGRMAAQMTFLFIMSVGVGYAFLVGATAFGWKWIDIDTSL